MPKVYFMIAHSGTLPADVVRFFTHKPYSHACFSFDRALTKLYSFGRIYTRFFIPGGFITGGIDSDFYKHHPRTKICVLEAEITEAQRAEVLSRLAPFEQNPRFYKYGFANCVFQWLGRPVQRTRHFTCSQFIAQIFDGILPFSRPPSLVRPMDFCELNLPCIFTGTAEEYIHFLKKEATCYDKY